MLCQVLQEVGLFLVDRDTLFLRYLLLKIWTQVLLSLVFESRLALFIFFCVLNPVWPAFTIPCRRPWRRFPRLLLNPLPAFPPFLPSISHPTTSKPHPLSFRPGRLPRGLHFPCPPDVLLNPRPPSPSSPTPSALVESSPLTKSFAGFPAQSKLVEPILNLESPSPISNSAKEACGNAALSVTPVCHLGILSPPFDPISVRIKSPRGVDSVPGSAALINSSLADSGILPSGSNTVEDEPNVTSEYQHLVQSDLVSGGGPENPSCYTVSSHELENVVDPSTKSLFENSVVGGCSRGDSVPPSISDSKISAPSLAEPVPLILRPVGLSPSPATDTTDTPLQCQTPTPDPLDVGSHRALLKKPPSPGTSNTRAGAYSKKEEQPLGPGLSNPVLNDSPLSEDNVESDCHASLPPIDLYGKSGQLPESVAEEALPQPVPITTPIAVLNAEPVSGAEIETSAPQIADSLALTSPNYPIPVSAPPTEPGPSNILIPSKFFTRSPVLGSPDLESKGDPVCLVGPPLVPIDILPPLGPGGNLSTHHHSSDKVGGGDCNSPNGADLDSQSTPGLPVPPKPDPTIPELASLATTISTVEPEFQNNEGDLPVCLLCGFLWWWAAYYVAVWALSLVWCAAYDPSLLPVRLPIFHGVENTSMLQFAVCYGYAVRWSVFD
ncbi:hypothetical protein Nepgr_025376 [Nepenthes gracilis]|uniref:Uncharacterized protein n=1 Tax=Nepenthes gracilis TaxID=150966 RepID=A0AAD3XZL9_NEPGR|nr:hypothetical protein Nepgr_025376 [Nepenthes gracilis]